MNTEKLLDAVWGVKVPQGYRMYPHEALALMDAANGDKSAGIFYAFRYGFLKGQKRQRQRQNG